MILLNQFLPSLFTFGVLIWWGRIGIFRIKFWIFLGHHAGQRRVVNCCHEIRVTQFYTHKKTTRHPNTRLGTKVKIKFFLWSFKKNKSGLMRLEIQQFWQLKYHMSISKFLYSMTNFILKKNGNVEQAILIIFLLTQKNDK